MKLLVYIKHRVMKVYRSISAIDSCQNKVEGGGVELLIDDKGIDSWLG